MPKKATTAPAAPAAPPAPQTTAPPPSTTTHHSFVAAAGAMKAVATSFLVHKNDSPEMEALLKLAVLPPMKVDGNDNPAFILARTALRSAMDVVPREDLSRKVNLFAQRTISGTATPEEISAMFGIYTAQGRRWQAHDVLAVQRAVVAIKTSLPALRALLTETFTALTPEGAQVRNLARQVTNTTYVSYNYGKEALPAYLKVMRANDLTEAAAELERHIGESNMRAVLAQQRAQERKEADKGK